MSVNMALRFHFFFFVKKEKRQSSMEPNEVAVALAAVAFVGLSFGTWRQAKIATTLVEKEYEVCGWLARILL
jgi:hypothetical protein